MTEPLDPAMPAVSDASEVVGVSGVPGVSRVLDVSVVPAVPTVVGVAAVGLADITSAPLVVATVLAAVGDDAAGGTALFCGSVRDHAPGVTGTVVGLEYSAHPDAADRLRAIATEVVESLRRRGRVRVAVTHRTGSLIVGDLAIVAAASAAHRDLAFDACRLLVDRVKAEVPIWKRELVADGGSHWVGLPAANQP